MREWHKEVERGGTWSTVAAHDMHDLTHGASEHSFRSSARSHLTQATALPGHCKVTTVSAVPEAVGRMFTSFNPITGGAAVVAPGPHSSPYVWRSALTPFTVSWFQGPTQPPSTITSPSSPVYHAGMLDKRLNPNRIRDDWPHCKLRVCAVGG
jgi:hypothetical protein